MYPTPVPFVLFMGPAFLAGDKHRESSLGSYPAQAPLAFPGNCSDNTSVSFRSTQQQHLKTQLSLNSDTADTTQHTGRCGWMVLDPRGWEM